MIKKMIIVCSLLAPTVTFVNASAEFVGDSADLITTLGLPTVLADFEGEGWESSLEGVKVYERTHRVFGEFKINLNMPTMKMVFYRDLSTGDWKRIATIGADDSICWNHAKVSEVFNTLLPRSKE